MSRNDFSALIFMFVFIVVVVVGGGIGIYFLIQAVYFFTQKPRSQQVQRNFGSAVLVACDFCGALASPEDRYCISCGVLIEREKPVETSKNKKH